MSIRPLRAAPYALAALTAAFAVSAHAQKTPRAALNGEQVYTQTCAACHATGVAHAPKFGDREAWKPLIAEGQHVLTAHAWVGVRAMPARGGNPDLSMEEFARGAAWMANKAGGDWKDPDVAMMRTIRKEAAKRLDADIREKQKLKAELQRLDRGAAPSKR